VRRGPVQPAPGDHDLVRVAYRPCRLHRAGGAAHAPGGDLHADHAEPGTAKQSVLMNVPKYDFNYQKAINLKKWVKVTPARR